MSAAAPAAKPGHLGIVGLGMIGGSLALAAKRAGWRVSAYNRTSRHAREAAASGGIDHAVARISELGGCDIIFVAVPISAYGEVFKELTPALAAGSAITDGGSTKREAIAIARQQLGDSCRRFVPAHPIAGREQSSWQAADADLYLDHLTIVCADGCDADAVAAVDRLWQDAGARTCTMTADEHDQTLATISHLPHLLSYALVSAIGRHGSSKQLLQFAAGGFRDFTRIAGSHPDMWRDICLTNTDNMLAAIAWYQKELEEFAAFLKNGDGASLSARFAAARALRQQWLDTLEK